MTTAKHRAPPITDEAEARLQAEIAADPDTYELTDAELAKLRPAQEVLPPEVYAALVNRGGRPRSLAPKVPVTIRLDAHIVEAFKATGPGWQTRMNDALARSATKLPRP